MDPEEKNISPFASLGLIGKNGDTFTRNHPDYRIINEWVVLYEIASILSGSNAISIDAMWAGEKGIQRIYNLSNVSTNEYLDKLDDLGYIHVDRTAGLDMIYAEKSLKAITVLDEYYSQR